MGTYQVRFYNDLVNDQGRCCKVLQRTVCVENARDAADAEREAERRFEELEGVPDWRLRARFVEVQRLHEYSGDAGRPREERWTLPVAAAMCRNRLHASWVDPAQVEPGNVYVTAGRDA